MANSIKLHYLARDLARKLVRELVCDLLWLNSITLSGHYAILLCDQLASWSQTCLRAGRKLNSVMEFGFNLIANS